MITRLLMICPLLLAAAAAQEIPFQYERTITLPPLEQQDLVAVPLDRDVFAAARENFADLRIHDASGNEIPFLLRRPANTETDTRYHYWTATEPMLRPLENGGLEITFSLAEEDPIPDGLCLETPLKNFEQRIRVETSADGTTWEPLSEPAVLFDYSRYMDVRNTCIELPGATSRHFRILIDTVTAEQQSDLLELTRRLRGGEESERTEKVVVDRRPFRIDRVRLRREVTTSRVEGLQQRDYPIAGFEVTQNEDRQTVVDIRTHREPLTSFTIETPARNFSRRAVVLAADDGNSGRAGDDATWREIASTTISRIDFKSLQQEQRQIRFAETRAARYRLLIDNRDSPPLTIESIEATGNVYEAILLADPDQTCRLVYGADRSTSPDYDVAALKAMLAEGYRPAPATLGPPAPGTGPPQPFRWSGLLDDRRVLIGLIVTLVVALALGLYHTSRRIETDEPPADAS